MLKPTPDERKTAILDAVVRVIIDVGFTDMTVADVARRAGVSTALVHYHFSSKAELITAALRVASDEDKEQRMLIAASGASALQRLDDVLCGSMPVDASDASWLLWIESWGETRRTQAIRDVMADLEAHETDVILQLLGEGEAAGEFVCADHRQTAERLSSMRDGLAIQQTLFGADRSAERFVGVLRGAIRHNLGLRAVSMAD